MQNLQPDSQGFVSVAWPSKNIPHGGVFHNRIVTSNSETQKLLKVLLEEAKLSVQQRQKSKWENRLRQPDHRQPTYKEGRDVPVVRPRTSRRRSLSEIRQSGVYDLDGYVPPKRGEDREKLKERLQNIMAFGETNEPTKVKINTTEIGKKQKMVLPTAQEKKHDLLTQIRERVEWLADMEYLGEAAPHRSIINDEINERIRALESLGLDDLSTARSDHSGFSIVTERASFRSGKSSCTASLKPAWSNASNTSLNKQNKKKTPKGKGKKEESVRDYPLPKLMYSPRRRC